MSNGKPTWYEKQTKRLENHPFLGRVLFAAFILGVLGGFINFAEKTVEYVKYLTQDNGNEIRIQVTVRNSRTNTTDINKVCKFDVQETQGNTHTVYYGFGDYMVLMPKSGKGTNAFRLKARESREYFVRFPNNQEARDLMDRSAAIFTLQVQPLEGNAVSGRILLEKDRLRNEKLSVEIKP